jgi:hypothetical protein
LKESEASDNISADVTNCILHSSDYEFEFKQNNFTSGFFYNQNFKKAFNSNKELHINYNQVIANC